jgi:hypothetical protein
MACIVYVEGKASWTAATLEKAAQLALPHLDEGRNVVIEGSEGVGPLRRWIFSADDDKWIEQSSAAQPIPSPSLRNVRNQNT